MAAGAWYTGSGLGDANISVGARAVLMALHPSVKNPTILQHPVMRGILARDRAIAPLVGALGWSASLAAIGQGKMAPTAEGAAASLTNYSTSNVSTITPARYEFARSISDFARSIQSPMLAGELSPSAEALIAIEGVRVWSNTLVDLIVALASSLTNVCGTTGTALSYGAVHNAVIDLQNNGVTGPALGLISAKGAKDLSNDMISLGGALANSAMSMSMIPSTGKGSFIGTAAGVDWYLCSELDESGGDTYGLILTDGAVQSLHQFVKLPQEAETLVDAGFFTAEGSRPGGSISRVSYVSYLAAGIVEQARAMQVLYVS